LFGLSFLKAHNLKNAEAQLMQNFLEYQKLLHTPR
jgi:tetratricopeptide (TPR) repeat protein